MKTLKAIAAIVSILLLNAPAFAGGGAHGEDGVRVNGKLVIREYIEKNKSDMNKVQDNKAFLESTPDFIPLIQEISAVNAPLAASIWAQLMDSHIWLTTKPIPILPEGVTYLSGPKTDVQIAIREDNNILIFTPAFNVVDQSYTLAHEGLHGMIPGDGFFHHEEVRDVVKYFIFQRGHFVKKDLDQILSDSEVSLPLYYDYASPELRVVDIEKQMSIFIQKKGSPESLCVLKAALQSSIINWRDLNDYGPSCGAQDFIQALKTISPPLGQLVDALMKTDPTLGMYYNIPLIETKLTKWEKLRNDYQVHVLREQCGIYAGPIYQDIDSSTRQAYAKLLELETQGKIEMARLKDLSNSDTDPDPAATGAAEIMLAMPNFTLIPSAELRGAHTGVYSINNLRNIDYTITITQLVLTKHVEPATLNYQANINLCTKNFGANYLTQKK
jgi:hypothetical protein